MATTKVKGKQVTYKAPGAGSVTRNLFDKLSELPTRADFATEQDYLNAVASVQKLNAEAVEFTPAGVGVVATTVETKLRETVSVLDFGAVGDNVTDNTVAFNLAADYVRGRYDEAVELLIPKGFFYAAGAIDFTGVRHINGIGLISSGVTSGAAVTIGTEVSANLDMDNGDIRLTVQSSAANNAALSGVVGIRLRGAARANFRLYSYKWDVGVEIAPNGSVGTQYVAFNRFQIYTNACRTGLKFANIAGPSVSFINENLFERVDCYPQNNALPGETIGVHFTGAYASNNNTFLGSNFEGQTVPIWFQSAFQNQFLCTRLESAGSIRFGSGTGDQPNCMGNFVHVSYPGNKFGVPVDLQSSRPNLVTAINHTPAFVPQISINFDDFFTVAGGVYSTKLINSTRSDGYFQFGVLDTASRSFNPGSNHSALARVKVQKGDILQVFYNRSDSDTPSLSMSVQDINLVGLPALAAGSTPYFGTDMTVASSGASGVNSFLDFNNIGFNNPFYIQINRDEVEYITFALRAGALTRSLLVNRLLRGGQENEAKVDQYTPVRALTDFTSVPFFPGQIGVVSSSRVAVGSPINNWVQIGQVPVSATAAQIASAADPINTTNKVAGLVVRDTTNNRLMFTQGSLATSPWYVADGSATVTPA